MKIKNIVAVAAATAVMASLASGTASASSSGEQPGTVSGVAELSPALRVAGTGPAKRVTYWTRTSLDQPALSSGAVYVPRGVAPQGGWPVVAWEHGTVGLAASCTPSVAGLGDDNYPGLVANWLAKGYAVVASDYIGLGTPGPHAYLDGQAEAHASIDMVRAARAVDGSLSTRWVAVGHSQGGQAALFTGSMATRYAPELDYRGAAVYAPGASVSDMMLLAGRPGVPDVFPPDMKAYAVYALNGLKAARPDFDLDSYLTPLGKQVLVDGQRLCLDAMADRMADVSLGDLLSRPLDQGDFAAVARPLFDIPLSGYDRPVLIAQGTSDADVPAPLVWKLISDFEAHGIHPVVHNYPGEDHETVMAAATPDIDPFVAQLLR